MLNSEIEDGLYHREIGLPADLLTAFLARPHRLTYSRHAIQASLADHYGALNLPGQYWFCLSHVIECEVVRGSLAKVVVRVPMDPRRDLVLVIIPRDSFFVKTVWANLRTDTHRTLDRSRYTEVTSHA